MITRIAQISLVIACFAAAFANELTIDSNGRYRDLLVAIDPTEPEDWSLVLRIQDWLTQFSGQLSVSTSPFFHNGTGSGLSLGTVSILVPKFWQNNSMPVRNATWQFADVSQLRLQTSVEQPRRTFSNGTCGSPGNFIAFDIGHVMNSKDIRILGKELLQEFARFRWGVFSEHGEDSGRLFYFAGNKLVPVICTRHMRGKALHNVTLQPCKYDPDTLMVEPNCRFFPEQNQTTRSSIMSTVNVPSVQYFCSDPYSGDHDVRHHEAPHLHQRQCGSLSVSRVMASSPDFAVTPTATQLPIQFNVVRQLPYRRIVIVMDISSSMSGNPIAKMITTVVDFIEEMLEDGIECALIAFNRNVYVLKPLTFMNSQEIRREFAEEVKNLRASGWTAIGDALLQAMRLLGGNPNQPKPEDSGYIFLLTDGVETAGNILLPQAQRILVKTSIFVDTLAFGNNADKRLAELSKSTNGISCFNSFTAPNYDMMECVAEMVSKRTSATQKPITLYSGPVPDQFSIPVMIDSTAGNGAVFMLNAFQAADILNRDLRVSSPNGTVYDKNTVSPDPNSPIYSRDNTLGVVTIRLTGHVDSGVWLVTDDSSTKAQQPVSITTRTNSLVSVTVSSKSAVDVPVILTGSVTSGDIQLNNKTKIIVTASLMRGNQPISKATILTRIESDQGLHAFFFLNDDGIEPDAVANDGIHSGSMPLANVSIVQEYNARILCEDPVNRATTAGKFVVTSVDSGSLESAPPATVRDLQVKLSMKNRTVSLSWTSVGDKRNEGTAANYEFKTSRSVRVLQETFDQAENLTVEVTPLPAGSQQMLTISMDYFSEYNGTFYVALRAVSSVGVVSEVSNVESLQFFPPENIESIDATTPEEAITTEDSEITDSTTGVPEETTTSEAGSRFTPSMIPGLILLLLVQLLA